MARFRRSVAEVTRSAMSADRNRLDSLALPVARDVEAAATRIASLVHRTPVMTSRTLNALAGAEVFLKCESFQRVGAFKARGACNALASMSDEERARGVVTHSSGNHAAALALAASLHGTRAWVVMPTNAPRVKREAVAGYGATIVDCEPNVADRERVAEQVRQETGAELVHPFDDPRVIAGQGTAAWELLDQVTGLDAILTPVGGGGLISGTCLATQSRSQQTLVYGAEPLGADDAARSKSLGQRVGCEHPRTVADGLRASIGELTWPFIRDHVREVITVEEDAIVSAMRWVWERMKLVIEPSSATVLAALFTGRLQADNRQRIGLIISGGNVDLDALPWLETR